MSPPDARTRLQPGQRRVSTEPPQFIQSAVRCSVRQTTRASSSLTSRRRARTLFRREQSLELRRVELGVESLDVKMKRPTSFATFQDQCARQSMNARDSELSRAEGCCTTAVDHGGHQELRRDLSGDMRNCPPDDTGFRPLPRHPSREISLVSDPLTQVPPLATALPGAPPFPISPAPQAPADGEPVRTPDDVAVILRLHALGWGTKRIAAEVGCARNTVKRYLAKGRWAPKAPQPGRKTRTSQLKAKATGTRETAPASRRDTSRRASCTAPLNVAPLRRSRRAKCANARRRLLSKIVRNSSISDWITVFPRAEGCAT